MKFPQVTFRTRRSSLPRVKARVEAEVSGSLPLGFERDVRPVLAHLQWVFCDNLAPLLQRRAAECDKRDSRSYYPFIFGDRHGSLNVDLYLTVSRHIPKVELDELIEAIIGGFLKNYIQPIFDRERDDVHRAEVYAMTHETPDVEEAFRELLVGAA